MYASCMLLHCANAFSTCAWGLRAARPQGMQKEWKGFVRPAKSFQRTYSMIPKGMERAYKACKGDAREVRRSSALAAGIALAARDKLEPYLEAAKRCYKELVRKHQRGATLRSAGAGSEHACVPLQMLSQDS
eukprot:1159113-Pelagomonas_calceolata.AAC.9